MTLHGICYLIPIEAMEDGRSVTFVLSHLITVRGSQLSTTLNALRCLIRVSARHYIFVLNKYLLA